jgi:hypothetical protein
LIIWVAFLWARRREESDTPIGFKEHEVYLLGRPHNSRISNELMKSTLLANDLQLCVLTTARVSLTALVQ